jgi:hypothetical protein
MNIRLLAAAATLALGACASTQYGDGISLPGLESKYAKIGYEGPLRDVGTVGIVTTDGIVRVSSVNGKPTGEMPGFANKAWAGSIRYQLHLPPGTHRLSMSFYLNNGQRTAWSTSDVEQVITLAPGQIVHLTWLEQRRGWSVMQGDGSAARNAIHADFAKLTQAQPRQ